MSKAREQRVRRTAKRNGLALSKSRVRTQAAMEFGRYHIFDPIKNWIVIGTWPWNHSMTQDDVEDYLSGLETPDLASKDYEPRAQRNG